MRALALARVLPLGLVGAPRARHLVERNLLLSSRGWVVLVSGVVEPLLYLVALGLGVGELVGDVRTGAGEPVGYAEFIAPALLASAAMNGPVFEMYNVFFKLNYQKLYDAALATPMAPKDVAVGEVTWSLLRAGLYAAGFLVVAVAMGLTRSWWAVLALPAALLVGFCFAAVTLAAATYMRSWQDFDLLLLFTIPMFLFSATFYPPEVYPDSLQWVLHISPLYHGVALIRGLMLGSVGAGLLVHLGVLLVLGAIGLRIGSRRLSRVLLA